MAVRYPLPKNMAEQIEFQRKKLMKELNCRNIPKTKFLSRYVKITFRLPNEIKKIKK